MEIFINPIAIRDVDTFLHVHGRCGKRSSQIYFCRALGFSEKEKDEVLGAESMKLSSVFVRGFESITDMNAIMGYAEKYDVYRSEKQSGVFGQADGRFNEAFCRVSEIYGKTKSTYSDTIEKNLYVPCYGWYEKYIKKMLCGENAESLPKKFICTGSIGLKEYLFCSVVSHIGIDVLMLLPEADVSFDEELMKLSASFVAGEYQKADFERQITVTAEIPPMPTPVLSAAKNTITRSDKPVSLERPERKTSKKAEESRKTDSSETKASETPKPKKQTQSKSTSKPKTTRTKRELTYEEIAELSESVVMIEILDKTDDGIEIVGSGSGIMIHKDGFILTNCHVAASGQAMVVRVENDNEPYLVGGVVKYNPDFDLAIIRIDRKLKPLKIYDGPPLKRGQKVVAIGSPLGLFNTISDGIISGFRNIRDIEMIQFTAPTTHGSSGGALLDMHGKVIGVSSAGIDDGQNLNFAVGFEQIRAFAGDIIK